MGGKSHGWSVPAEVRHTQSAAVLGWQAPPVTCASPAPNATRRGVLHTEVMPACPAGSRARPDRRPSHKLVGSTAARDEIYSDRGGSSRWARWHPRPVLANTSSAHLLTFEGRQQVAAVNGRLLIGSLQWLARAANVGNRSISDAERTRGLGGSARGMHDQPESGRRLVEVPSCTRARARPNSPWSAMSRSRVAIELPVRACDECAKT